MKSPMSWSISTPTPALLKRFALIYLPIVIALSLALLLIIRFDEQTYLEKTEVRETSRIEIAKERIVKDFNAATADVRILAHMPLLRSYLDIGNPAQREELEKFFLLLSRETRRYDKVRYLDASGQEVIRINYNNGKPAIVPRELMQNMAGRYFFRDALKLDADEIYVSPLDLNVEQDRLEIPHKPAIRFGTPVFDSEGHRKGIVLLNYFGEELRQNFREVMKDDEQRGTMLLNRDGYWLSSDKREDEWGFMLGNTERTFGHDFPAAWRAISAAEQGTLLTEQGLFAYTTAYPLLPGQSSSTGSTIINASSQRELMDREYHWKIVSFIPQEVLSSATSYNQIGNRIVLAIVYLLLALAAWFVARITLSRQQAERALADALLVSESEKKFRVIFEGALDGIVLTDAQSGLVEDCNPEFERQCGRPLSQIKTLHIWELRPPELQETAHSKFEEVKATGHASADLGFQRPDGTVLPAELSATHARIGGRNFIISISRDITERKQAERTLKLQSDNYTRVLNAISDGLYVVNRNYDIEYLNPVLVSEFGEAAGRKCFTYFHDRTEPCPWCKNAEVFKGNMVRWEWHSDKTGKTYDLLDTPIINADGSVSKIEIFHDITERKLIEKALQESERNLADAQQLSKIGSWVWILATDVMQWSEELYSINGYNTKLPVPKFKDMSSFYTPDSWKRLNEAVMKAFDYGESYELDLDQVRSDGVMIKANIRGEVDYDASGKMVSLRGTVQDITERKQAEQVLSASLAEKEVLMREIHHRVKNNMQMMSALLELQSGYVTDEQARVFFKDSQQRIQSMAMIHEQLYHNKNLANIDFAAYLHSLMDNLHGQYNECCSLLNIRIDASACTLPVDIAIPCGLVVTELVSNVFKHAFPNGRAGELRIGLQCNGDGKVILEVADDGVGLPAGLDIHHSKSFGLQVVTLMVEEQLHGKLSVESNVHGTRVVCEIGGSK